MYNDCCYGSEQFLQMWQNLRSHMEIINLLIPRNSLYKLLNTELPLYLCNMKAKFEIKTKQCELNLAKINAALTHCFIKEEFTKIHCTSFCIHNFNYFIL